MTLPLPPPNLLQNSSLFLDFDGTLVEIVDRPDGVRVDAELSGILASLAQLLPDRVAIVSGRSIEQLDILLGASGAGFALSGSHGAERRTRAEGHVKPPRPAELDVATAALRDFASSRSGLIVEAKSLGTALHFRMAPEFEHEALRIAEQAASRYGLSLQRGKMMVELKLAGDKGVAIRALMSNSPMHGTRPVVFGDDLTDEPAFVAAAAMGGAGVLVGPTRETAARYHLPDVRALRAWFAQAAETSA